MFKLLLKTFFENNFSKPFFENLLKGNLFLNRLGELHNAGGTSRRGWGTRGTAKQQPNLQPRKNPFRPHKGEPNCGTIISPKSWLRPNRILTMSTHQASTQIRQMVAWWSAGLDHQIPTIITYYNGLVVWRSGSVMVWWSGGLNPKFSISKFC